MFDKFEPYQRHQKKDFSFQPIRYEMWIGGKMVSSGKTNSVISACVISQDGTTKVAVKYFDKNLNNELSSENIFDEYMSLGDRLQLLIIPEKTNAENASIKMYKMTIGTTRNKKDFNRNEPYCCNLFFINKVLSKVTFSFSNPDKLIEFYNN